MDTDITLYGIAAAPIISALIQPLKKYVPADLLVYVAVGAGTAWNVGLTLGTDEFTRATVFIGIITGLAASGLYSAARPIVGRISPPQS